MAVTIARYDARSTGNFAGHGSFISYYDDDAGGAPAPEPQIVLFGNWFPSNQMAGGVGGPSLLRFDELEATAVLAALNTAGDFTSSPITDLAELRADCPELAAYVDFLILANLIA